jgi:hypothetical protein
VARTRTTKKLAQRIDLNYFKRPTPLKRARFWLSIMLPALALVWIAYHTLARDHRVYSSGRMSAPHAILERECAACHVHRAAVFSAKAQDSACLACHDGPVHHAGAALAPNCATCHTEHRGRVDIKAVNNKNCAECHSDLKVSDGATHFAAHIKSFEDGHPQFAALRDDNRDPGTIQLNHAIHMRPIRRGPNGPMVQLECGDCHHPAAVKTAWKYSDAQYVAAKTSYTDGDEIGPEYAETLVPRGPATGRELMAPVKFSTACASCHLLSFDKHFDEGVPHDKPEVVHAYVVKKFQGYIAMHPSEARVVRDPDRDLTGKPLLPQVRVLTPPQWVAERTADAEELLWRKTCKQCHTLRPATNASVPQIAAANTVARWMPHAKFDHDAHNGFSCVSCHEKALTSTQASDVLLPGIATCQTCHAPGPDHAESRCFECHTYHDWTKRQEVNPRFTLPALQIGGK